MPVEGEGASNGYGYGRSQHEMVDELESERSRLAQPSRAGSRSRSVAGKTSMDEDGEFGLRKGGMSRVTSRMGAREEYAEFLRSSSSTGGSKEFKERVVRRKGSVATDLGL